MLEPERVPDDSGGTRREEAAMRVQDVMTTKVLTIDASDSVDHACAKMQKAGVHQLVVCGKRGRIIGVIGAARRQAGSGRRQRRGGLHVAQAADRPTGYRAGKRCRADARESDRLVARAPRDAPRRHRHRVGHAGCGRRCGRNARCRARPRPQGTGRAGFSGAAMVSKCTASQLIALELTSSTADCRHLVAGRLVSRP